MILVIYFFLRIIILVDSKVCASVFFAATLLQLCIYVSI